VCCEENLSPVSPGSDQARPQGIHLPDEDQPEVYSRGKLMSLGELCANDNDMQHVVTSGNYRFGGISLKLEDFAEKFESMLGVEFRTVPAKRTSTGSTYHQERQNQFALRRTRPFIVARLR